MFSRASSIRILIAVIVLACVGLLALQVRLLQNTAELRRATFEQNVMAALASAARSLEERSIVDRVFVVSDADSLHWKGNLKSSHSAGPVIARRMDRPDSSTAFAVMMTPSGTVRTWFEEGKIIGTSDRPQQISVEVFDMFGRLDTTLWRKRRVSGDFALPLPQAKAGRSAAFVRVRTDQGVSTMRLDPVRGASSFTFTFGDTLRRDRMVRRVVESFAMTSPEPVGISIAPASLDSLMGDRLRQQSIDQPFAAALVMLDSVMVASDTTATWDGAEGTFRLPVGAVGPFAPREELVVQLPSWRSHLWAGLWPELSVTAALFALIVGVFVATLRTIRRQQEFAGRLSDFIGNMTHEFKTPLATISLASEALTRADVKRSPKKIDTYNAVIRDENRRMGSQVERILQMASLEEGELELRKERLSLHTLVAEAAHKARMLVQHRGGTLEVRLDASDDVVLGDRVHLENVLHNLFDNAIKYSPDAPALRVSTENDNTQLRLIVRDRGVGIAPDQQERVFEKYYRVPTGNVHDVKGFGLGLSYVKLVVTSLGGTVHLTSKLGDGTEATISLPLVDRSAATKNT
jgi:signal transduction histidine kinase